MVSDLAGLLPPKLRRTAAGAWLDVKSLPGRMRDPARWDEPLQALHNVGGGDFAQVGAALLAQLVAHAGLTPACDVLDIGCGTGRLARPLAGYLDGTARYTGFDVSATAVATCATRIGRRHPNFRFVQADIRNTEYNPHGRIAEADYCFPVEDGSVEMAAAFSVFSHMVQRSIDRYLQEGARALRPGGRFAFTAYALTPERISAIGRGEGRFPFKPWRDGAMTVDPRSPERAIAHPLEALERGVAAAGLRLDGGMRAGGWIGTAAYEGGQDLFVAVKG